MYNFLFLLCLMQVPTDEFNLQRVARFEEITQVNTVSMNDAFLATLSRTPPFLHIANHEFILVYQWGTRGQGPGELTYPVAVSIRESEIWVLNKLPNRINIYRINGEFLRSINLDQAKFVVSMKASNGRVLVQDGGLYSSPNKLFSIEDGEMNLLESFELGEVLTLKIPSGPPLSLMAPYSPRVFWDLMGSDTLITYSPDIGITLRDANLQVLETWEPPKKAHLIPDEARSLWLDTNIVSSASFPASSAWRMEAEKAQMPQVFAQVLQMQIDGDRIWLLRAYLKEGQLWECYRNQNLVGIARLPFSSRVHLIQNGFIFLSDPDQEMPFTIFELRRKDL